MTSEFISGILWGIALTIWLMVGYQAIKFLYHRKLLRQYPGGIIIISETGTASNTDLFPLAKYHRENPDIAIIYNGRRW